MKVDSTDDMKIMVISFCSLETHHGTWKSISEKGSFLEINVSEKIQL